MEVTNEMDCSRTESNEGLTHLSISGERENDRYREGEVKQERRIRQKKKQREGRENMTQQRFLFFV